MNMFKSNGGFTLVELIVVIAILAILAGVAVPAYSGYISKANEAADQTLLDSVKTAAIFKVMDANPAATVTKLTATQGSTTVTVEGTATTGTVPNEVNVAEYVPAMTFKSNNTTWVWTSTAAKWVPASSN